MSRQSEPGRLDPLIIFAHRNAIPLAIGSLIALGAAVIFLVEHFMGDRWIGWRLQVILMSVGLFGMLISRALLWLVAWDERRNPP